MEIKKIIGFCKKSGNLNLFEGADGQWISDGSAIYPLINMPRFTEESILTAYDISEKKASKMNVRCDAQLPNGLNFANDAADEIPCEIVEELFGNALAIMTQRGMMFINSKYLQPFPDVDPNLLYIFERHKPNGDIYFAVKIGFILVALVAPYACVNEKFVDRLGYVYEQCKVYLQNEKREAEE